MISSPGFIFATARIWPCSQYILCNVRWVMEFLTCKYKLRLILSKTEWPPRRFCILSIENPSAGAMAQASLAWTHHYYLVLSQFTKYRRSLVSAAFGSPEIRTIGKTALIGDWFSTKIAIWDFWIFKVPFYCLFSRNFNDC